MRKHIIPGPSASLRINSARNLTRYLRVDVLRSLVVSLLGMTLRVILIFDFRILNF